MAISRSIRGGNGITIVSPGLIIGTHTEGVANVDDYIWRLSASCIRLKAYNAGRQDTRAALSDARVAAETVIRIALGSSESDRVVTQVGNCITWAQLWEIFQEMGYELKGKATKEWLAAVHQDVELRGEAHPLWSLAYIVNSQAKSNEVRGQKQYTIDQRLKMAVRKNIELLCEVGFVPRPDGLQDEMRTR